MARKIGVAVIGMGWMGEVHSRSYRAIPDRFADSGIVPRLVVCVDPVESRAQAAQARFGFERYSTNWRDVLTDTEVEVVNVTAPNGMHLEINRAVAAAGKHLLCEKPVGKEPGETVLSAQAAKEAGIITGVGYNYRWAPVVQYARQLIADGKLGQITHYHGRFLNGYAGDPRGFLSWRFETEHGLGTLSDLMSHVIDMAHMLAGPITRVISDKEIFIRERPIPQPGVGTHYDVGAEDGPKGDVTNEDYVSALVHFERGARGILESCRVINGAKCDMSFEVHGTRGWGIATGVFVPRLGGAGGRLVTSDGTRITFDDAPNPYVAQVRAFAGWVAGDSYAGATGQQGALNIALLAEARAGMVPANRA